MQLTPEEREALERYRLKDSRKLYSKYADDLILLSSAMLRLFPVRTYGETVIRWDDEITPERLVACGFVREERVTPNDGIRYSSWTNGQLSTTDKITWFHEDRYISRPLQPRSMGEVWQLMERIEGDKQ